MRAATLVPALLIASLAFTAVACSNKSMLTRPDPMTSSTSTMVTKGAPGTSAAAGGATAAASNPGTVNGRAGAMPAYYDDKVFTINFTELVESEAVLLVHNMGVNKIYTDEVDTVDGKPFVAVLDAIQGDGFNPLWQEIEVRFTAGHTPRQITRDDDVVAAAAAGEVTLHVTDEVYRCSVIGPN
jgi:hypothetical protein